MRKKLLLAILRVLSIAGQIGLVKLYTRYLLPAQLGQYYFFLTVSYSLNALLFVPVDYFQQAQVFELGREGRSLHGLFQLNAKLFGAIGILFLLSSAVTAFFSLSLMQALSATVLLSALLYVSTAAKNFLNNQDYQLLVVIMLVIEIPIRIMIFFALVKLKVAGPLSPLIATAGSYLLVTAAVVPTMRSLVARFKGEPQRVEMSTVLKFSAPISGSAVLNWLQLQGYRLVLVPMGYAEAVGLFATTSQIGNAGMNGAATVYQQIYMPRIYQTAGKYLRSYLKGLLLVIAIVATVGLGLRNQIVGLITNGRFTAYAWVLGYGIFVEAGNFVIAALVVKLTIDNNTRAQVKANILAAVTVPLLYLGLYFIHGLSVYTIGVPLVVAQAVVVSWLILQSEINPWKNQRSPEEAMPSLS
jgi:O-antigen/teichoic acid export membrane protein